VKSVGNVGAVLDLLKLQQYIHNSPKPQSSAYRNFVFIMSSALVLSVGRILSTFTAEIRHP